MRSALLAAAAAGLALALALPSASARSDEVSSQEAGYLTSYIEVLRSDVRTRSREVITEAMAFDGPEAEAFWPLYREYEGEAAKLTDERIALIREYAEHYDTMDEKTANDLIEKSFKNQEERLKLRRDMVKKVSKTLSPERALRFAQVDHRLGLLVDVSVASELPLAR